MKMDTAKTPRVHCAASEGQ